MKSLLENGEILFGADHTTQPQRKYLLKMNLEENFPSVFGYGGSDDAALAKLGVPFDNPKPVDVAREFVSSLVGDGDIVVDFFAGSGTTGHAVMAQNIADGLSRHYILVQLPEPIDMDNSEQKIAAAFCRKIGKLSNVAELTKERLRRGGALLRGEQPLFPGDMGFRVFKLDSSNIRTWDPDSRNLERTLLDHEEHVKGDRSEDDVLYEILLKLGLDLCVPTETRTISGKTVHSIGGGTLVACLDSNITRADAEGLGVGIGEWMKSQAPAGDVTCILRDSAFAGQDVTKSNLSMILQQHGVKHVRSV